MTAADGLFGTITNFLVGGTSPTYENSRIQQFKNKVNNDGMAYHHLYQVSIYNNRINSIPAADAAGLRLFCTHASIPPLNIMSSSYRENESHYEVPYGISREPLTLTFYADRNMRIKTLFDAWYGSITNARGHNVSTNIVPNNRLKFMDDFTADIEIDIFDKELNFVYTMILKNAWPKSIGNIDVSHQNTEIITFPVTFEYERSSRMDIDMNFDNKIDAAQKTLGLKPLGPSMLPVNVFNQAAGAAGEIIQGIVKAAGPLGGKVNSLFGGASIIQNEITSSIRDNVTKTFFK